MVYILIIGYGIFCGVYGYLWGTGTFDKVFNRKEN